MVYKRLTIGRRTRQYNAQGKGAASLSQWLTAVLSAKGESDQMTVPAAVEMIRATPPERRNDFARQIWRRRRERGTDTSRSVLARLRLGSTACSP